MKRRSPYNIEETFYAAINENSQVDKESSTVRGVCIMNPESRNGRVYTPKAVNSIRKLAENKKCFLDHGDMFGGQSVTDMLGNFSNVKKHGESLFGDLEVLQNSKGRDLFFEIAENYPHLAGFSIVARGKFADKPDSEGREVVEDVTALRSIDFVGEPATTNGVFEGEQAQSLIPTYDSSDNIVGFNWTDGTGDLKSYRWTGDQFEMYDPTNSSITVTTTYTTEGGESVMDKVLEYLKAKLSLKGLTEEGQADACLEYIKEMEKTSEELKAKEAKASKEADTRFKELKSAQEELDKVNEELKIKTAELDNFHAEKEAEKRTAERRKLIAKIFEDEKLDKKDSSETFESTLMELGDSKNKTAEQKIRELVQDRKSKLSASPVTDSGVEQEDEEVEGDGQPMTEEKARAIIAEAFE